MNLKEVIMYVENCYLQVLKRPVDPQGKDHYVTSILQGDIKTEDLPNILKQSREYKEQFMPQQQFKKVLVVTPVRMAAKWLPRFRLCFERLNYPRDKLHFAFSVVQGSDDSYEQVRQFENQFSHVNIDLFTVQGNTRFDRLAKTRNRIIEQSLKDQQYVFSIDSDIVDFPPGILDVLIQHDVDVVAPLVVIEGTEQFYDTLAFVHQGRQFNHLIPYCKACREKRLFEVDSVGTCYLVKRKVYDAKVRYGMGQNISEQITFCNNARQKGFKVWVDPNITVFHANLRKYGENFH